MSKDKGLLKIELERYELVELVEAAYSIVVVVMLQMVLGNFFAGCHTELVVAELVDVHFLPSFLSLDLCLEEVVGLRYEVLTPLLENRFKPALPEFGGGNCLLFDGAGGGGNCLC